MLNWPYVYLHNSLLSLVILYREHGIETRVYQRPAFNNDVIEWADVIFTAGGDGTFLDAASKILTKDKPVIGINTDPIR